MAIIKLSCTTNELTLNKRDNSLNTALHLAYKCNGLKVCEFIKPELIQPKPEYDRVNVTKITDILKDLPRVTLAATIPERIRQQTEKYVPTLSRRNTAVLRPLSNGIIANTMLKRLSLAGIGGERARPALTKI
jgi:hypothetical protein